ncbi:MAG: integrase core domain-containing protein, partial [Alphaproteobacteria bacterium]
AFLKNLIADCPFKIHRILTDNGAQFTYALLADHLKPKNKRHPFDQICQQNNIIHKLTQFKHPWTNGQVETFNKTLKKATVKTYHYDDVIQLKQHLMSYLLVHNYQKKLKALKFQTPYDFLLLSYQNQPHLFKDNPNHKLVGLNTFAQAPSSGPLATLQDTWNQMTSSLGDRWHQFASGFGGSVNAAEIPEGAVPLPNAPTITASTSTPETWGFGLDLDIGQGLGAFSAVMATVQLMGTWKTINTKERLLLAAQATAGALAAAGKVNPFLSASLLAVNTVRASTKDAYEEKTKTFQSATNNFTKVCNQQAQTTPEKFTKCARIALGAVQVVGSWVSAAQSMVANTVRDIGRTQEDKVVQPMLTQKASEVQAFVAHKTQDTLQTLQDKTSAMGAQAQKVANDAVKMAQQTQTTMAVASNMLQSATDKAKNLFASWFSKGAVEAGA